MSAPPQKYAKALGNSTRWIVLRALADEVLPVGELARRTGLSENAMSKQMAVLREAGIVERRWGVVYGLAEKYHPEPGAEFLDLGHCLIRLWKD